MLCDNRLFTRFLLTSFFGVHSSRTVFSLHRTLFSSTILTLVHNGITRSDGTRTLLNLNGIVILTWKDIIYLISNLYLHTEAIEYIKILQRRRHKTQLLQKIDIHCNISASGFIVHIFIRFLTDGAATIKP